MPRHCYVLRVFTRDGAGGNHLGVVTDILGLDDHKMQRLATDLGFSETIFLSWFEGNMPKARIFTPAAEIPFAGHPLVGAAWVLLNLSPLDPDWIECPIGVVGISQENYTTWVHAPADQQIREVNVDLSAWVAARETVEVTLPLPYLMVQLDSPEAVHAAPVPSAEFGEVYLWAWEEPGRVVRSRFFASALGVPEDPATGSAAVALAMRMRWAGQVEGELTIHQGEETGYPSRILLRWDQARSAIGGTVAKDEVRFVHI
jgi:predicted PhzF superfamily epimerase YddE/YHI9